MTKYVLYLGAYKVIQLPDTFEKICLELKDFEYDNMPDIGKELEWFKKEYPQANQFEYKLVKNEIIAEGIIKGE